MQGSYVSCSKLFAATGRSKQLYDALCSNYAFIWAAIQFVSQDRDQENNIGSNPTILRMMSKEICLTNGYLLYMHLSWRRPGG